MVLCSMVNPRRIGALLEMAEEDLAGAGALFGVQLVYVGGDRQIFEAGKMAPPLAPLHPPQFLLRLGMRRNVIKVDRLAIQFLGEAEQQLRQIFDVQIARSRIRAQPEP